MPDTPPSQKMNNDRAESSFIDENDPHIPYTKLPRNYGDGELRIGSFLSLNEDIYSLGFVCQIRNEIINEATIKEEASRPKTAYTASRTPTGSFKTTANFVDGANNAPDFEDEIYEDEQRNNEWEAKMMKIYEERTSGRTNILINVMITAFCQGTLVFLLFTEVVGTTFMEIGASFGVLTHSVTIICARFICTIILHLS